MLESFCKNLFWTQILLDLFSRIECLEQHPSRLELLRSRWSLRLQWIELGVTISTFGTFILCLALELLSPGRANVWFSSQRVHHQNEWTCLLERMLWWHLLLATIFYWSAFGFRLLCDHLHKAMFSIPSAIWDQRNDRKDQSDKRWIGNEWFRSTISRPGGISTKAINATRFIAQSFQY